MTEVLFIAYFLVLLGTLIFKTPIIKSPWLFLMRAFFPNWKFFHAVGHVPHLYARAQIKNAAGEPIWSEWQCIYPRRQRRWLDLFHNPHTNLGLAQQNLVDHFWADLYDLPEGADARELVTYQLVLRLVQQVLCEQQGDITQCQFELRMELFSRTDMTDSHTMMTSPVVPC
jgi:hypothetical protein